MRTDKLSSRDKLVAASDELAAKALAANEALARAEADLDAQVAEARSTPGVDLGEEAADRLLRVSSDATSPADPVVVSLGAVAAFLAKIGRLRPAEELYQRYLDLYLGAFPEQLVLVGPMRSLAGVMQQQGRFTEAERVFRRAMSLQESALGPKHLEVGVTLFSLAEALRAQGKVEEAEPFFKRSLAIRDRMGPEADALKDNELFFLGYGRGRRQGFDCWGPADSSHFAVGPWPAALLNLFLSLSFSPSARCLVSLHKQKDAVPKCAPPEPLAFSPSIRLAPFSVDQPCPPSNCDTAMLGTKSAWLLASAIWAWPSPRSQIYCRRSATCYT